MSFEYDAVGNRTKRTDYLGRQTSYEYDVLNRLKKINYLAGAGNPVPFQTATYNYDDLSRLTSAVNDVGTVAFTYDNRNRVKTTTDVFGHLVEYGYDANSNRTQLKLDSTVHTTYAYDIANRLTTLTDESSQNFTFGYDIANRLISKAMPNGISSTFDYDGMSRLTRLRHQSGATLTDNQFTYNPANQIGQISELSQTKNFTYDTVDRLTGMTNGTATESYTFDGVGNRTASHKSASYTYQPFNKLTSTATATYQSDANGNMVQKSEGSNFWRYIWDYENRLTTAMTRKQTVRYKYDALGRRVQRHIPGLRESTKFIYDGLDVVMDDDVNTGITKYQNGLGIDNKLKLTSGGVSKYFLQDHLGSTVGLADSSGAIVSSASYDSFGNSTNNLTTRYQYTGREFDSFTGLQYSRARWCDSNIGRFISEDPLGFIGGPNLYAYVGNHPVMYADPLGLFPSIWPLDIHQQISSRALAGLATSSQIASMNYANADFDRRTQDPIYAPYHAMRRPGQSVEDARAEANEFVRDKICLAREYASRGWNTDAMHELGKAIHALQDSASPEHTGFQEAWPNTYLYTILNIGHYVGESYDPKAGSVADENTRRAWDYFTGRSPMPNDFFSNGHD